MYAYVLSYVRFNLKVRSHGLLNVPAVHARGNKWGGFRLCTKKLLCFSAVSVLSFPVLDGIVVTASVFACHAADP